MNDTLFSKKIVIRIFSIWVISFIIIFAVPNNLIHINNAENSPQKIESTYDTPLQKQEIIEMDSVYNDKVVYEYETPVFSIDLLEFKNINTQEMNQKLFDLLNNREGKYSVYVKNLNTGEEIEYNSMLLHSPASLFKLFTAVREIEELENVYPNIDLNSTEIKELDSTKKLFESMIVYSNNDSQSLLLDDIGRNEMDRFVKNDLGLTNTALYPFMTCAKDIGLTLEKIYNKELISSENSQYLINLLLRSTTKDRIKSGLPEGVLLANKSGTLKNEMHDAGIVFGRNGDYVIVVLASDIKYIDAKLVHQEVSRMVWGAMNM